MGVYGLHVRVNDTELAVLESLASDQGRLDHFFDALEESKFGTTESVQTHKTWRLIHAAMNNVDPRESILPGHFGDGQSIDGFHQSIESAAEVSAYSKYLITGREVLISVTGDYLALTRKSDVERVSKAISSISQEEVSRRIYQLYNRLGLAEHAVYDSKYAAGWYPALQELYACAAAEGQHILFSASG